MNYCTVARDNIVIAIKRDKTHDDGQ